MRLLLDENITWRFRDTLIEHHDVWTTGYLDWNSIRNGRLLALARDKFDVLITADQSIPYQQNITEADVAVVVLCARTSDINDLTPLVPDLQNRLSHLKRVEYIHIEAGQN